MTIEQVSKKTQVQRILDYLKERGSATNVELNRICFRYSARLHELRREGHIIVMDRLDGSLRLYIYRGHRDD